MYNRVLVFGGTGFVGKNLQAEQPNWVYFDRGAWDHEHPLEDLSEVLKIYDFYKPDAVLHLAAKVGGIKDNAQNQATYFYKNTAMNTNILHGAFLRKIPRVLSSLSTCAFPNVASSYPFSESHLFEGPPAPTNFSYGFTKRMLQVQSVSYRAQHGMNYSTFCPSNIYGPHDHFGTEKSHFVPALIDKLYRATEGDNLEMWGTGQPLRQQLYVRDLVKIIPLLLEKHNSNIPLIVAPPENLSIAEMTDIALKITQKDVNITYNNRLDGQYRKDGDNSRLLELIGDFNFTSFVDVLSKTYA